MKQYLTTRITEFVAANPNCTAWQIEQGLHVGWCQVNMTLTHLKKRGVIVSRKKVAAHGCHAPGKEIVNHWRLCETRND